MVIKEVPKEVDWVDYMDAKAMETMLKMEGDVFAITIKEPSDPSTFIVLAVGQLFVFQIKYRFLASTPRKKLFPYCMHHHK